jgi:DNA-binding NtrC family response regulator
MHAVRFGPVSEVPVLIQGETGTGKELVARALHRLDPRRCGHPFVAVNCAAINPNVAESEFFGHRRGSFTGADRHRKGLIPSADGGVLFLDEVGELDLELQAKLLRVLQEGRVLGVGEDRERAVDVRIVAATNRDLLEEVRGGRFRSDLYYRLSALLIRIPALHERKDDLLPLVQHFFEKHRTLRATPLEVGADFLEALRAIRFDGNIRQLENLIRELMLQKQDGEPLHISDLPTELLRDVRQAAAPAAGHPDPWLALFEQHGWQLERCTDACERMLLDAALRRTRGNQSEAARILGVTPRTIYNKLRKHHLTV